MLKLVLVCALLAALSVHVEGCTAIGFAIGASADAHHESGGAALLLGVKVGRQVSLLLWNGHKLEGRFAGWSHDSATATAIAPADTVSPRGMTVRLATSGGEVAIPAENIAKVTTEVNGGKLAGLLVGLAADAMVIASVRSSWHTQPASCGTPPQILSMYPDAGSAPASAVGPRASNIPVAATKGSSSNERQTDDEATQSTGQVGHPVDQHQH